MIFALQTLVPEVRDIGTGRLAIDNNGHAFFWKLGDENNSQPFAQMESVQIIEIAKEVILFSGVEPDGFTTRGIPTYNYQKWCLRQAPERDV